MLQIPKLKELSFLVYGLGLTGLSVVKFFKKNNIKNFKVWDDGQKKLLKNYRTTNLINTLEQVDYVVLAPGISFIKNKNLIKYKNKIITDIDLFYLINRNIKSIVITGTNGKSTTCKIIEHLLKKNKLNCFLGGNIGTPILDFNKSKKNYIIIEASSFQLFHSKFIRPDFAFFLNFRNDHLDWHGSKSNYFKSKLKIFHLQSKKQFAFINKKFKKNFLKNKFLSRLITSKQREYKKIKIKIDNDYLTSKINDENMSYVYTFAKLLKISDKSFISSMKSFKGLPHRFEILYKKNNITFINDSKATSFAATEIALSSIKNIYWILGGLPKKNDKINLTTYKKNIIKCYLIGKNISFFEKKVKGKINYSITRNLKNSIVKISKDIKLKKLSNKYLLFSPAAASFDQFINFEKRGEEFKRLCKTYARKFI